MRPSSPAADGSLLIANYPWVLVARELWYIWSGKLLLCRGNCKRDGPSCFFLPRRSGAKRNTVFEYDTNVGWTFFSLRRLVVVPSLVTSRCATLFLRGKPNYWLALGTTTSTFQEIPGICISSLFRAARENN